MSETHVESKVRNKGQFQKGNPGGPGNPHAKQVARIRATLLAALEPETLYQIVCQLIDRAVRGNLEAIKILLAYAVGRPGKSDNLIELLTEHYPPASHESDVREQVPEDHSTDAQPAGQAADLPNARGETASNTSDTESRRHQTDQTADTRRHQTDQTADVRRQQTDQTAEGDRHQTDQSARCRILSAPSPRTAVRG